MADKFAHFYSSFEGPATDAFTVTPGVTVFTQPTRALYVGGAGNITVQMAASSNSIVTFTAVPAGTTLPVRVVSVFANSSATSILGLF